MTLNELCRLLRACEIMNERKKTNDPGSTNNIHNMRDFDNTLHYRETDGQAEELATE